MRSRFRWLCASLLGALLHGPSPAEEPKPAKLDPVIYTPAAYQEEDHSVQARFTVREDIGDGVGYRGSFSYLEAFLPVRQSENSLLFANTRIVNYDHDSSDWELQGGVGFRRYNCDRNRILGANSFWDWRDTPFS